MSIEIRKTTIDDAERVEKHKTKDINKNGNISYIAVDSDRIVAMCWAVYPNGYSCQLFEKEIK